MAELDPAAAATVARAPAVTGMDPRVERMLDYAERLACVLMFAPFAARIGGALKANPGDILLLLSEGLVVFFVVFRRRPSVVSAKPVDWLMAVVGTAAPLLAAPGGQALVAPPISTAAMAMGLMVSIWAKLTLRRSFGLAPANRGVVARGPYSFVRHPMYAGYILVDCGFLAANPLPWNAAIYSVTIVLLVLRVIAEERILVGDPAYRAFMQQVRFRLAPLLF
jgi:protein-S-isoprenylcysteine O-methyltransferase Ste14